MPSEPEFLFVFHRVLRRWRRGAVLGLLAALGLGASAQPSGAANPAVAARNPGAQVLSLAACIELAVAQNRVIRAAYLDRVAQQFDLRVAESLFLPKALISPYLERSNASSSSVSSTTTTSGTTTVATGSSSTSSSTGSRVLGLTTSVSQAVPTGARFSLGTTASRTTATGTDPSRAHGWNLGIIQPLLKGGGLQVGMAPLTLARYQEQGNLLNLKAVVSDTLVEVITAYRTYFKAIKALEINRQSVARSKELLVVNRSLVATGRMAEIDLVQSEADVANQEFSLLSSEGAVDTARLTLLRLLGAETHARIEPEDNLSGAPSESDERQALEVALANRPDYQAGLLALEVSRLQLVLAQNNLLPDLSVTAGYQQSSQSSAALGGTSGTNGWNLGLRLTVPVGDLTPQQGVVQAQVNLEKTELALRQLRESVEIDVQNALRNLEMNRKQVVLSLRARELAERKFAVEAEKIKVGRSSNFQLVSFQNDLVAAQNNELNARIALLDAQSTLDHRLGVTLDRLGVSLVRR